MTKSIVDAIDPKPLKAHVSSVESGDQSLVLLERYVSERDGDPMTVRILRDLQGFRSRGGIAHLENSNSAKAAEALGISGLSNLDAFNSIAERLTAALSGIAEIIASDSDEGGPAYGGSAGVNSDASSGPSA